jgi:polyribonucleotide nucleotidyltransferase
MLHYNFPAFSTGEVKPDRGPSRREIGHGALAEKAILKVIPSEETFPYTIRIVSDILESNGSSSMATVCGTSLALMDAGVPIKNAVAGVAMGLVKDGGKSVILTDIVGLEDHFGDMDFKVVGTSQGICALQLDLKTDGISISLIEEILTKARKGISFILGKMNETINSPRANISSYAPRIYIYYIRPDKIGELIGPGGKTIKAIVEETGVKIDVEDSGKVLIASTDEKKANQALEMVKGITASPEIGKVYTGRVVKIMDFGAFVEILPGKDGLVHVSQLDEKYVDDVRKVVKENDEITVKVIDIDSQGRVVLSRKQVLLDQKNSEKGKND